MDPTKLSFTGTFIRYFSFCVRLSIERSVSKNEKRGSLSQAYSCGSGKITTKFSFICSRRSEIIEVASIVYLRGTSSLYFSLRFGPIASLSFINYLLIKSEYLLPRDDPRLDFSSFEVLRSIRNLLLSLEIDLILRLSCKCSNLEN